MGRAGPGQASSLGSETILPGRSLLWRLLRAEPNIPTCLALTLQLNPGSSLGTADEEGGASFFFFLNYLCCSTALIYSKSMPF